MNKFNLIKTKDCGKFQNWGVRRQYSYICDIKLKVDNTELKKLFGFKKIHINKERVLSC